MPELKIPLSLRVLRSFPSPRRTFLRLVRAAASRLSWVRYLGRMPSRLAFLMETEEVEVTRRHSQRNMKRAHWQSERPLGLHQRLGITNRQLSSKQFGEKEGLFSYLLVHLPLRALETKAPFSWSLGTMSTSVPKGMIGEDMSKHQLSK